MLSAYLFIFFQFIKLLYRFCCCEPYLITQHALRTIDCWMHFSSWCCEIWSHDPIDQKEENFLETHSKEIAGNIVKHMWATTKKHMKRRKHTKETNMPSMQTTHGNHSNQQTKTNSESCFNLDEEWRTRADSLNGMQKLTVMPRWHIVANYTKTHSPMTCRGTTNKWLKPFRRHKGK